MPLRKDGEGSGGAAGPSDGGADALRQYRQALDKGKGLTPEPGVGPTAGPAPASDGRAGAENRAERAAEAPTRTKDWKPSTAEVDAYLEAVRGASGGDQPPAKPDPSAVGSAGATQDPAMAGSRISQPTREIADIPDTGATRPGGSSVPESEDPLAKARAWLEGGDLEEVAQPVDAPRSPQRPPASPDSAAPTTQGGDEALDAYQKAKQKLQATQSAQQSAKAAAKAEQDASFRASLGKLRNRRTREAPQPPTVRDAPAVGAPKPKRRPDRKEPKAARDIPAWQIKAGVGAALLLVGLLTQWQVYRYLNGPYSLGDLAVGLVALLAAGPLLIWVHPRSPAHWVAVISGATVVSVVGCAGFAFGQWFSQTAALRDASLVTELFIQLGLFTFLLGPLLLALFWLLDHMDLLPQ